MYCCWYCFCCCTESARLFCLIYSRKLRAVRNYRNEKATHRQGTHTHTGALSLTLSVALSRSHTHLVILAAGRDDDGDLIVEKCGVLSFLSGPLSIARSRRIYLLFFPVFRFALFGFRFFASRHSHFSWGQLQSRHRAEKINSSPRPARFIPFQKHLIIHSRSAVRVRRLRCMRAAGRACVRVCVEFFHCLSATYNLW